MNSQVKVIGKKNSGFKILINDTFLKLCIDPELDPTGNKNVLSIANDFEDGLWRFEKFQRFVWDNISETSLSLQERQSLAGNAHTLLAQAAKNLRFTDKDVNKGSELAEIVLYGIMKQHYAALPVVPKIFYKQNAQDNAKGADSVHIVLEGTDDFSIWFGEAKFYNSLEDSRLSSIVQSVGNSLKTDKLRKENSIISSVSDIDALISDQSLREKIKSALSNQQSIDHLKPKINIPILLLHECQLTSGADEFSDDYLSSVKSHHIDRANAYFKRQIATLANTIHKYGDITFHIILFPVPDKKAIVDKFLGAVEFYKGQ